jgi:hypothetical protein
MDVREEERGAPLASASTMVCETGLVAHHYLLCSMCANSTAAEMLRRQKAREANERARRTVECAAQRLWAERARSDARSVSSHDRASVWSDNDWVLVKSARTVHSAPG